MPGLWKEWKAKGRLPTLSTSPLEISPKAGAIPTFPQRRRRRRMGKWKTKTRFSTFPPPLFLSLKTENTRTAGGLRPPARQAASRLSTGSDPWSSRHSRSRSLGAGVNRQNQRKETLRSSPHFRLIPYWNTQPFQAHLALESILDFRLICGLENAAPRGAKSLRETGSRRHCHGEVAG